MSKDDQSLQVNFSFLSTLCHELRSPLFPIIALSDLILKQPETAADWSTLSAHISMMHESGHQLLELIHDLHTLSRIETKRYTPKVSTLNLREFLEEPPAFINQKTASVQDLAPLQFEESFPQDFIHCDQEALLQVYSGMNEIVHAHQTIQKKQIIHVHTNDQQLGFRIVLPPLSEESAEGLFKPFWKSPWKLSEEKKSNGLKFCLVHSWAKMLGGQINIVRHADESFFSVSIPFCEINPKLSAKDAQEKHVLISDHLETAYQAILSLTKNGIDTSIMSATRYRAREGSIEGRLLVDTKCSADIEGLRVSLPEMPELNGLSRYASQHSS